MNKRKKAKRKRWVQARAKSYQRMKYAEAFRECFVRKGILRGGGRDGIRSSRNN